MASNYTGNQGATQAPSGAPTPDANPVIAVPVDGADDLNAASVAQGFKVAADWIAWLTKPKAIASSWAQAIRRYRSAGGHTRALVDHLGFLNGRVVSWDETWAGAVGASLSSGGTFGPQDMTGRVTAFDPAQPSVWAVVATSLHNAAIAGDLTALQTRLQEASVQITNISSSFLPAAAPNGPWLVKGLQAVAGSPSAVTFHGPDNADTVRHRWVSLLASDTAGDYAILYRQRQANYVDDVHMALEWELFVKGGAPVPNRYAYFGFCDEALSPGLTSHEYLVFQASPTGNWSCDHEGAGGGGVIDSGVAITAGWHRFRIEFHGASVSDNATRAARWYIDGALVGTATTDLPGVEAYAGAHASVVSLGGAAGVTDPFRMGPMRFRSNIYAADVI